MAKPYVVAVKVQYPEDTNLSDVRVTVRQNATNESYSVNTDSGGNVNFNLGSTKQFASGYTKGDTITIFVIYQGFEKSEDHTIDVGGHSTTLVLTAVPAAPSLVFFKPQEFLDVLNLKPDSDDQARGIKIQQMIRIGEGVESDIENDCDTKFDSNDGDYYSQTDYFDDVADHRVFAPRKRPVVAITSLTYNTSREGSADSFDSTGLTENTEFFVDQDTDHIKIARETTKVPDENRLRGWRLIYTYGRAAVPDDIKLLAIYETAVRMGLTTVVRAKIHDKEADATEFMSWFRDYRNRLINKYRNQAFVNT